MTRKVLMVFALLCAVVQGVWAWDGNGTQADPYQISSVDDWNALATAVDGGESYSGKYFKLTNNIDKVETMVGSSKDKAFRGHFYGASTESWGASTESWGASTESWGASTEKIGIR